MEKNKALLERIRFESWAKDQEYDLSRFYATMDFSNLPAYIVPQTYDAWAGWFARAELEIKS